MDENTPVTPPVGPYSPAVRAGHWLACSGQLGIVDGELVAGGVKGQLRQALANLEILLSAHGVELTQVIKTTVFLIDMGEFEAMNATYVECFGDHRPARSAIGVAALPRGAVVEIEAWAYTGE